MLLKVYIIILCAIAVLLALCICNALRKKKPLAKKLALLQFFAILALLANILFVASENDLWSNIGFSLFSLMIDWILVGLYFFVIEYTSRPSKYPKLLNAGLLLAALDSVSLMANAVFNHVFRVEPKLFLDHYTIYEATNYSPAYFAHLALCYGFVIFICVPLISRIRSSSRVHRSKYLVILSLFGVLLILDGLCVALHVPLNASILVYSFLALATHYYALYYQPNRLITDILRIVIGNLSNGIAIFDDRQKCIYANDGIWEMFHLEKDVRILEKFAYPDQHPKMSEDGQSHVWQEKRMIDGGLRYFEMESQNIFDENGLFVASYFNITDQTERELLHEKEVLLEKEANRAKSDFLSRVSHDIRTPMNAISGMNEMILRENRDPAIQEYAENIEEALDVLMRLINDVLDFSRIEAGKMTLVQREYSTSELLQGISHIAEPQVKKHGLSWSCSISDELPRTLLGDDVKLRQIMLNLLSNAVKYTPEGEVSLQVKGEWSEKGEFFLLVAICDTGIGIKKEDIPKLFEAFERFEEVKNHSIQGTGLGLNITSHFLKMMGSRLDLDSEYGVGSTFSFRLPQQVVDKRPISEEESKESARKPHRGNLHLPNANILVVDDNAMNLKVFCFLLKNSGIHIDTAESGAESIELVRQNHYDLIYLDHMMPGMDGVETLQRMKALSDSSCPDTPVIMLTANTAEGAGEKYLEEGFSDFLPKPVTAEVLEANIEKYLGTD